MLTTLELCQSRQVAKKPFFVDSSVDRSPVDNSPNIYTNSMTMDEGVLINYLPLLMAFHAPAFCKTQLRYNLFCIL